MTPEEEKKLYTTLDEARLLAEDDTVPAEGEFSLEEILAEYGGSTRQKLMAQLEEAERAAQTEQPAPTETKPKPERENGRSNAWPANAAAEEQRVSAAREREAVRRKASAQPEEAPKPEPEAGPEERSERETARPQARIREESVPEPELPPPPRPISMEDVVSSTVDSVMEERKSDAAEKPRHRRSLFSRRPLEETEELYAPPPPEPEPVPEWEEIGEEPEAEDEAWEWKRCWQRRARPVTAAMLLSLIGVALLAFDFLDRPIPYWSDEIRIRAGVTLGLLVIVSILGWDVYRRGFGALFRGRCSCALLSAISALVAMADCVAALLPVGRGDIPLYGAVACLGLTFSMIGGSREARGLYDSFRTAAVGEPPYMVTDTPEGPCKQQGLLRGFSTDTHKEDLSAQWQNALLPLILVATVVFAGLSSLGRGQGADFLPAWSAILAASTSFALPLSYALPWSRLTRRLQKSGCAVAGWSGAQNIAARSRIIVTDEDLFPPGTISLNGIKVFGEELPRAASYAASLAVASGSGLGRLFDSLLRSEGGRYQPVEDFSFYEEGGCSAFIHGESVLLGTASFMRKMEVRLPGGLNLRTGIFLAVDRQLTAVFAVKYKPSDNVDWALRMLRKSHITLLLASRDPNVTPELIRRKFTKVARLEYPNLSERVALSEQERALGMPRALLYREGLLPYAEAAAGSRRLCGACRWGSTLALLGSICGTLLSFYLVFQGAYGQLSPMLVLVFQLLWTLPTLILSDWVGRL